MKIDFEFQTPHGVYRDALYLPDDHTYTQEQISAMQAERLNNWIYAVENPPPPPPSPFVEIDGVTYEKVEIDGQVVLKPVINQEVQVAEEQVVEIQTEEENNG